MHIGEQIRILRNQKKWSRNDLARGICTAQALANIEDGVSVPDQLLVDVLIQRLGKSPDKLEYVISAESYKKERMRNLFEELVEKGKLDKANFILEKYYAKYPKNDRLQKMFYCRSRAYMSYRLLHDLDDAKVWIMRALDTTLSGWEKTDFSEYRISTFEMENLLAYAKICFEQGKQGEEKKNKINEVKNFLQRCQSYIQEYVTDGEEFSKIFPKLMWLQALCNVFLHENEAAMMCCKKGFYQLRLYNTVYFMHPLLKLMVTYGENLISEKEYEECCNYLKVLEELYAECGEAWHFSDSLFHNCYQKTYHLDYELIRGERLAQGYTQEKLIEGIYEMPESLSRVESGHVSPSGVKYKMLMERLHMRAGRYNSLLITESFEILELQREIAILISRRLYDEAEICLEELQRKVDESWSENERVIHFLRNVILLNKKGTEVEDILNSSIGLLLQTYHISGKVIYRPPTIIEADLINQIAKILNMLGKKKEAEQVYKIGIMAMEQSKIALKYRYRSYSLLQDNFLKNVMDEKLGKKQMKYELSCGKLGGLYICHMMLICVLIAQGASKDLCKKKIMENYYLCRLSMNDADIVYLKEFYERYIGEPFNVEI